MAIPFNAAANAYANAAKLISQAGRPDAGAAGAGQTPDFSKMLNDAVQSVEAAGKASDQQQMNLLNGKANMVDVVTSVAQTQMAVEGLVSVRDRVISAYEEIMRMPI
jgi:flagellar hook-basal body complex protein FliE